MHNVSISAPHHSPLDFNTPARTDTVADATVSEAGPFDASLVPAIDIESLLGELGLSDRAVREILVFSSIPSV